MSEEIKTKIPWNKKQHPTKLCERCNTPFTVKLYREKTAEFCSLACTKNRISKPCERCGIPFSAKAYRGKTAKFCSLACVKNRISKTCGQCNSTFEVAIYRQDTARFCSKACGSLARSLTHTEEEGHKRCAWCSQVKPVERFYKSNRDSDGLIDRCIDCHKTYYLKNRNRILERNKQRRLDNGDAVREKQRARWWANRELNRTRSKDYRERNKAEIKRRMKEKREKNRDKFKLQNKAAYRRHRDKRLAYIKEYVRANPEIIAVCGQNRRAREVGAQGAFTRAQWLQKLAYHGHRCYLCGVPVTQNTLNREHRIPLSRNGSNWIANIAPACKPCNLSKGQMTEKEYRELLKLE